MKTFQFIFSLVLGLGAAVVLISCEKPAEPIVEKDDPIEEVKTEAAPAVPEVVEKDSGSIALPPFDQLSPAAQAGLGNYYTAENINEAGEVIEVLAPEARSRIVEALRKGKKIEAVKVVRERGGVSLAVSKIAVEIISIKEGIHPDL